MNKSRIIEGENLQLTVSKHSSFHFLIPSTCIINTTSFPSYFSCSSNMICAGVVVI
uniref:Uncharacterized protein n=1 Tax=Arundo donax TaxID=35708 RepID=A0A0A9A1E9_ARUDO